MITLINKISSDNSQILTTSLTCDTIYTRIYNILFEVSQNPEVDQSLRFLQILIALINKKNCQCKQIAKRYNYIVPRITVKFILNLDSFYKLKKIFNRLTYELDKTSHLRKEKLHLHIRHKLQTYIER